ncbi:hypothetical protein AB4305_28200 [Nocardia sp. 2YAB30]|uniref:hypothetical protein n=1 Tax=Nocardia sp. 2YAB30 TaxID=3233022 RepID=UPI003F953578
MGADHTLDDINSVIQQFADKVEEIKNQPDKVDDAFDALAIAAAASEGSALIPGIGAVIGGAYGAITHDDLTGYMSDHKVEIKQKIKDLLQALHDAIEATEAPIALLQTSGDWLQLKAKIGEAQNDEVNNGNLTGYWKGTAADRYGAKRLIQDTAMDSAKAICDTLKASLVAASNAAWQYYTDVAGQLAAFLVSFGTALTKISTLVEAPWGISDAIDLLKVVTDNAVTYMKTLTTALRTEVDSVNNIKAAVNNPKGIYNDKWPQSASKEFDTNDPSSEWTAAT